MGVFHRSTDLHSVRSCFDGVRGALFPLPTKVFDPTPIARTDTALKRSVGIRRRDDFVERSSILFRVFFSVVGVSSGVALRTFRHRRVLGGAWVLHVFDILLAESSERSVNFAERARRVTAAEKRAIQGRVCEQKSATKTDFCSVVRAHRLHCRADLVAEGKDGLLSDRRRVEVLGPARHRHVPVAEFLRD